MEWKETLPRQTFFWLPLFNLKSGHAGPFSPPDFYSLCVCVFEYSNHNGSCWPGSAPLLPPTLFSPFFLRNVLTYPEPLLFYIVYMLESVCQLQEKDYLRFWLKCQ